MNKYATKATWIRVLTWLAWFVILLTAMEAPSSGPTTAMTEPLLGVVSPTAKGPEALFPWLARYRWKKWTLHRYRKWRRSYRQAKRRVQMAKLAMSGMMSMAQIVDLLTASQVRYKLGALPVLYALLQTLEVERIINDHCPTQGEVGHGTVALVLVLNRLILPLPLYQISDWVGQTCLVAALGIAAEKFNDDRLGRTLDALYPHLDAIWQEILEQALFKAQIDLSVIFYDVTAFMVHGRYAESELVEFGFAHNTPSNKRKLKLGLNASADGGIPLLHRLLPGSTADQATVERNLENLAAWLHANGHTCRDSLIVGDRAMLNAEIAILYDAYGLRHLTGLRASTAEQKRLLYGWSDEQMEAHPIVDDPSPQYWGRVGTVTFIHEGKKVVHKALAVVSGPLRDQWRQSRQARLEALFVELEALRNKLGDPYLRTVKSVQRSVNARLKESKVGRFVNVTLYTTPTGQLNMFWELNQAELTAAERRDGRYLLVTNDWSLSPKEMFRLYKAKDGVEKCFRISKSDLKVSPLFLHKDKRISAMLFINMVALLAYTLLQRQMQQQGLQMTTRRLIQRLDQLTLIETHCWDGSSLRRLTPIDPELITILQLVAVALDELMQTALEPDQQIRLLLDVNTGPNSQTPRLLC
jgi:transposase